MSDTNRRNYGIDILRCLSMFFVIVQHIFGQGGIMENAQLIPGKYFFLSFFQILSYCAVDVFGITTGYLMCEKRFQLSRLSSIWLTTVFWSVAVSCGFFLLLPESRTISELVSMFLPILRGRYWFFTAYFVVMLLSPVLNVLIRSLSRRQFHLLLAVMLLLFGVIPVGSLGYDVMRISGGNHFSWMIALYLIGGYIRSCIPPSKTRKETRNRLLGYFAIAALHLLYKILVTLIGFGHYGNLMLTCVSPLVVAESVCLFLYFRDTGKRIPDGSLIAKFLRFAAPGVYSVYIIHVHPLVFWNQDLIGLLRPWDHWNGITILAATAAASLAVFFVCIALDFLRQQLFRILKVNETASKICGNLENIVRKHIP